MAAYIVFTILLAIALCMLTGFIVYKWIKKMDKQSLGFLILIDVCILVAFIGCACGWGLGW